MAGTLRLSRLVSHARAVGAHVRLLGDPSQLSAVEAGGALRLIATEVGASELTILHRFDDPAEAAATLLLRNGNPACVDFYEHESRLRSGTHDEMLEAAYQGWLEDTGLGYRSLMIATKNEDVSRLSRRARAERVALGQVSPDGVELADQNVAGRGDLIVTRRNRRTLQTRGGRDFVKNGDIWSVSAQHHDGSLSVVHGRHGGRVLLPFVYVREAVELAYATTVHRAQGLTVDTSHPVISEGTSREAIYVAATRARTRTHLYLAASTPAQRHPVWPATTASDPHQMLRRMVATSNEAVSATEVIRRESSRTRGRGGF